MQKTYHIICRKRKVRVKDREISSSRHEMRTYEML